VLSTQWHWCSHQLENSLVRYMTKLERFDYYITLKFILLVVSIQQDGEQWNSINARESNKTRFKIIQKIFLEMYADIVHSDDSMSIYRFRYKYIVSYC